MKFKYLAFVVALIALPASATVFGGGSKSDVDVKNTNKAEATAAAASKSTAVGVGVGKGGDGGNATAIGVGGKGGEANAVGLGGKATSGSISGATGGSVGNVRSNSKVGDVGSNSTVGDVGSSSNSAATVGDTAATVGDTTATVGDVTGGDSTAASSSSNEGNTVESDTDVTVQGDNFEAAAASAATVFAGYCQTGASGQITGGGFSVVNPDAFCDHVRLADTMRQAYEYEVASGRGEGEFAAKYLEVYHDNLHDAIRLIEGSEWSSYLDRQTGFVIRPAALIGLLIWLL
jgi:hypothetical protein